MTTWNSIHENGNLFTDEQITVLKKVLKQRLRVLRKAMRQDYSRHNELLEKIIVTVAIMQTVGVYEEE